MIIYKVENKINHKIYIGQTVKTLEKRRDEHYKSVKRGSSFKFHNALRKYNSSVFKWSIIEYVKNKKDLKNRESYWIEYYKSYENGYNLTKGDSNPMNFQPSKQHHDNIMKSKEVRDKISNSMKKRIAEGKFFTEEHRRKISEKLKGNKHFQGHKRTPEAIEASAKSRRRKVNCYDMSNNLIKQFNSLDEATIWIYENNIYPNTHNKTSLKDLIKRSNDKNKFYNGLIWKYQ